MRANPVLPANGKRRGLFRVIIFAAAAGTALAIFSGCSAQAITRAENLLAARKAASLKGWEATTVNGRPLMESLRTHVAMLTTNFDSVSVGIKGSELSLEGDHRTKGGIGSAVPISNDGYFLTAAHVIDEAETLHLIVGLSDAGGRAKVEGIPARVVWKSHIAFWPGRDWSPGEPLPTTDIAIIHAQASLPLSITPFRFAGKALQKGDPVIIAGWSLVNAAGLRKGVRFAAGKIVSVAELDAHGALPAFMTVHHDAPVAGGDSGGPVVDRSGNLIGITSVSPVEMKYIATATMPDLDWLREVIGNDRRRRD